MTFKSVVIALISSCFLLGCLVVEDPSGPGPQPDSDLIGEMCCHLKTLECEEAEDVYNDDLPGALDVPNQSCGEFYRELQDSGVFVNPRCILLTPDCENIENFRAKNPKDC